MTLRRTEIIEWSTTPKELRRIADEMEKDLRLRPPFYVNTKGDTTLEIYLDQGQWQAEQVEDKE